MGGKGGDSGSGSPGMYGDGTQIDPYPYSKDNDGKNVTELYPLLNGASGQQYGPPEKAAPKPAATPPAELNLTSQPATTAAPTTPAPAATNTEPAATPAPQAAPSATNTTGNMLSESVRAPPAYWSTQAGRRRGSSLQTTQT